MYLPRYLFPFFFFDPQQLIIYIASSINNLIELAIGKN